MERHRRHRTGRQSDATLVVTGSGFGDKWQVLMDKVYLAADKSLTITDNQLRFEVKEDILANQTGRGATTATRNPPWYSRCRRNTAEPEAGGERQPDIPGGEEYGGDDHDHRDRPGRNQGREVRRHNTSVTGKQGRRPHDRAEPRRDEEIGVVTIQLVKPDGSFILVPITITAQ